MLALLSCGQGAQDVPPPLLLASLVVQVLPLPGEGARFSGADADAALPSLCWDVVWGLHHNSSTTTTFTGVAGLVGQLGNQGCTFPVIPLVLPPIQVPICPPLDILMCESLWCPSVLSIRTFVGF